LHPGNILLLPSNTSNTKWTAKLLDLPFLQISELRINKDLITFNSSYSAPELISGNTFDHRADLYSVGALLYALLVGDPARKTDSTIGPRFVADVVNDDYTAFITPEFLGPIVKKLLHPDPEKRFGSSYFLLQELNTHVKVKDLHQDSVEDLVGIVTGVPLIPSESLSFSLAAVDSWVSDTSPSQPLEIFVSGLPGSGKQRLLRSLTLYLRAREVPTARVAQDANSMPVLLTELPRFAQLPTYEKMPERLGLILGFEIQPQLAAVRDSLLSQGTTALAILSEDRNSENGLNSLTDHTKHRYSKLVMSPLTASQAGTLIDTALAPNTIPTGLKTSIASQALRHAGLILQQLSFLCREGHLYRNGIYWEHRSSIESELPLAPAILDALSPIYDLLPDPQVDLLVLLSLAPFPAHSSHLAVALASPPSEIQLWLCGLCEIGLIEGHAGSYTAGSSTIRKLVGLKCTLERRVELARLAMRRLTSASFDTALIPSPLITHYALQASEQHEAYRNALLSIGHYESLSIPNDALHFYRIALASLPAGDATQGTGLLTRALKLLGQLGNLTEFQHYANILETAIEGEEPSSKASHCALLASLHAELASFEQATRLAQSALQLSSGQSDPICRASALATLAWIAFRRGDLCQALILATEATELYDKVGGLPEIRFPLSTIAGAYYLQGDYSQALKCERRSLTIARQNRNYGRVSQSQVNLGILLMESGNLRRAHRAFSRSKRLSQKMQMLLPELNARNNIVMCYQHWGDIGASSREYRNAQHLHEKGTDCHVRDQSALTHADNLLLAGQIEASLLTLSIALESGTTSSDKFTQHLGKLQKSHVLHHAGCDHQSIEILERLLPILNQSRYRVYEAYGQFLLADCLIRVGRIDEARSRIEAGAQCLPSQNFACQITHRLSLARFTLSTGELAHSNRQFLFAAQLSRKSGFRRYLVEAWLYLTQTFLAMGSFDDAGDILRKLNGLHQRLKLRLFEPWLFQVMADHAAAVGEERESKKHLLNARTSLLEMAYNISDMEMRRHFLNRQDSRALLARSEDLEDLAYEGFPEPQGSPQATRALESIARINEQLHRRDSLKSTLGLILDEAIRLSEAERGIIFLFDPSGREELKVSRNVGRRSLADARRYTRTALQRIRHGEIVFAADTFTDPQLSAAESITQLRIRSVTCVPLRSRNSVIGALYLDSRRPRLAASPELLKSLEIFGQQAAAALERAIRYFHLTEENRKLRETALVGIPTLIGQGTYFMGLKKLIAAASNSDLPVLILGESGTGKELVARAIHYSGKRRAEPFLSVDCGALPENLVESELFGYRRGAFTGADQDKEGLFVAAGGGSLFLDEIGNTAPTLQAKLLRAIQEREIRPVGATQAVSFQARLIAATNRDLRRDARDGRFRQDLLFRLNGITIEIPSLRDRKAEVPLLMNHFLQKTRGRYNHRVTRISDEALQALSRYDWPGNIRELENCIERAVALAQEETIHLKDLPDSVRSACIVGWSEKKGEHRLIEEALLRFSGDKSRAADYIGWNRQKLYRKMEQYNIPIDFGRRNTA
jgi:Nif-specific regulatory protein